MQHAYSYLWGMKWKAKQILFVCTLTLLLPSCDDLFEFEPWEVEIPADRRDLNERNIQTIKQLLDSSYSFAVIGDPHFYYDDLKDVLNNIEARNNAQFILVNGDLTDQALIQEFNWYCDAMLDADIPFISVIGNHDHLANGKQIYETMFGQRNQVLTLGGTRFILFDNVEFESDLVVEYDWLDQELAVPFDGQTIVCMHIQPTDVQLIGAPLERLNAIMNERKPDAVFMGHIHSYATALFPGGSRWTTAPWPRRRQYLEVFVTPDTITRQLIKI